VYGTYQLLAHDIVTETRFDEWLEPEVKVQFEILLAKNVVTISA
jgi:hypothetical protein